MKSNSFLLQELQEHENALAHFRRDSLDAVERIATKLEAIFAAGNKLLLCGNGGSAAQCQHLATEFAIRFQRSRRALPAIALTADTSVLTAEANDLGYEWLFCRQLEALGAPGDLLLAISTSGESNNVCNAVRLAKERGLFTAAFCGGNTSTLARGVDLALCIDSQVTARIQEFHMLAGHLICALVERTMQPCEFPAPALVDANQ